MASRKKSSSKKPRGMWSQSKGKYSERAAKRTEWAKRAEGKPGYEHKRMKGVDGKQHTYMTKTDSRGRMRIIDQGGVAPMGYVQGHKGYYGLKRNLRLLDTSSDAQKAYYGAHEHELMGANRDTDKGLIDTMAGQGQVNAEKGVLFANFRKSEKARRDMNDAKAFFDGRYHHAGQTGRKMSKFILAFGQDGREA